MDDGLVPGFAGCDISASPSSCLLILHNNHDDITPLLSLHNVVPGGSSDGEDLEHVDCGVTHARLHDDPQNDNDDDEPEDTIAELLGPVSQQEDTGYDDDGVDVSVSVRVGVVGGVGVSGQGVSLGVFLGVGLILASLPPTSLDS